MSAIQSAVVAIAAVVEATTVIRKAPSYPTEQASATPFAAVFVLSGHISSEPVGSKKKLLNIAIDVLVARKVLQTDMATLTSALDEVGDALIAEVSQGGGLFGNTIVTFGGITISLLPKVDYGSVQHIGYRFVLDNVKLQAAI